MNDKLENLVKIGSLKHEPPDQNEINSYIKSAQAKQKDAKNQNLSLDSRFELTYAASHSLSLAALRWHGYRSENRATVFQSLVHTLSFDKIQMRILSDAHNRRNLAAYEGETEVNQEQVDSMIRVVDELFKHVQKLGPCIK